MRELLLLGRDTPLADTDFDAHGFLPFPVEMIAYLPRLAAAHRCPAAQDGSVPAAHEAEVRHGTRSLRGRQRQRKPSPIGQFSTRAGNSHALFLGVRGQSDHQQSDHCECTGHTSRSPPFQTASVSPHVARPPGRVSVTGWRQSFPHDRTFCIRGQRPRERRLSGILALVRLDSLDFRIRKT